jgi:hypothetical protein
MERLCKSLNSHFWIVIVSAVIWTGYFPTLSTEAAGCLNGSSLPSFSLARYSQRNLKSCFQFQSYDNVTYPAIHACNKVTRNIGLAGVGSSEAQFADFHTCCFLTPLISRHALWWVMFIFCTMREAVGNCYSCIADWWSHVTDGTSVRMKYKRECE